MKAMKIPFSPPDITSKELFYIKKAMKSGWITSGPLLKQFEEKIKEYCCVKYSVGLSSATAGMELILKVFDIKAGDDIITTPYTYAATANVCLHRGIKPIFVDVKKDSFLIDIDRLSDAITQKTKAILTVDIGGIPADFDKIKEVLRNKKRGDIVFISDSAHTFGAKYKGMTVGGQADFHVFSFHAVKNLTTAEGGAITYNSVKENWKFDDLCKTLKITSLHGQTKDAFSKMQAGSWKYDIITDGFKCNMTDILAGFGLGQIERYDSMLIKRKKLFDIYNSVLKSHEWANLPFDKNSEGTETSYHLFLLRINKFNESQRDKLIENLALKGIATNVHFMPLPMFSYYKSLDYSINDYPNAFNQYKNEISLPLYSTLKTNEAEYVANAVVDEVKKIVSI